MARVEWARLSGDDVEHVLSVMLAREHPTARRIRPSQGDRGLDVVVPRPELGGFDVYQVKSFAVNLGSNEKRQIKKSFKRVVAHAADSGLPITGWYLVLPLDPTPQNTEWFDELTTGSAFPTGWRGLIYVDGLAAKYPDVIDYYLRDGKDRLAAAVADLTAIVRTGVMGLPRASSERGGPLAPADVQAGLVALHTELNRYDPHYRYDFAVDAVRPDVPDQPWLVYAAQVGDDRVCVTFKVFARFAEATSERPIPLTIRWKLRPDSPAAAGLQDWATYGAPFEAPLGSADLELDLPGGLGGEVADAAVRVGPAATGKPYQLRTEVVAQTGDVLASCLLNMNPVTVGVARVGSRASGTEQHGVFAIEMRFNHDTQAANLSMTSLDITGRHPTDVLPGLRFLAEFHPPNGLRFALPFGPATHTPIPITDEIEEPAEADVVLHTVEALATIQEHTQVQVRVPDLTAITRREAGAIVRAARLLRGETLTGQWDVQRVRVDPTRLAAGEPAVTVMWDEPLTVRVGDVDIDLGVRRVQLLAVKIDVPEGAVPDEDGLVEAEFHPFDGNRDLVIRRVFPDFGAASSSDEIG
ncbi:MAG TPA: hypothetical protein VM388_15185 [Acidimicrobiales bacterium]|nr:hypothetical protein [Acidimicrobiales bacterium]